MHYTQVFNSTVVTAELARGIAHMPKVEIHVHLEGATSEELIFEMARRNHMVLPAATLPEWKAYYEFRDFNHFIDIYLISVACMKTPQDFVDMVVDFMGRQASQNIQYSEVFFSAALHFGKLPANEILAALVEGVRQGKEEYGVGIAFIPDLSREMSLENNLQEYVLEFALQAKEQGIGVGLGIGGKEVGYPPELYRDIFAEARRQGLHVVAHGGETGGPHNVRGAVEALHAERIGHGISALDDEALVRMLGERQIPIEVSPQSNYCTRVVKREEPHPIRRMVDAGLYCTVNSDDPAMFSTDLNNEYLTLAAQGFTFEELWQLDLNGLGATFLSPTEKDAMKQAWERQIQAVRPT
ncbi:MAG: adenosine deaminase [Chloroflexi bacterium]|nr:adenosine deaminase [Chloroflexota bacterium]